MQKRYQVVQRNRVKAGCHKPHITNSLYCETQVYMHSDHICSPVTAAGDYINHSKMH